MITIYKHSIQKTISLEVKDTFRVALPLIASSLVQSFSSFAGTIMLAKLGPDALAAGALVSSIYMTIVVFMFGVLSAISVLVAQSYGAKHHQNVALAGAQGIYVAILTTILMVILLILAPYFLQLTGQDPNVIKLCIPYLHASILSVVTMGVLVAMEHFLIGIGKTKLVLMVSLVEVPLEIFACYGFIFGKFGFPKMGIAGISYGFATVFIITGIFLAALIKWEGTCKQYKVFTALKTWNWKFVKEIFRIGTPTGIMYIIEVAFWMVMAFFMGKISVASLDAHQIVSQFSGFTFMIIWGLTQAITVRVGYAVGRNDRAGVKLAAYVGEGISIAIMSVIVCFYWIFPKVAIGIDIDVNAVHNQDIVKLAVVFFAVMAFSQLGDAIRFIVIGALRGIKDTQVPLIISAVVFWLFGLPIGWWLTFKWQLGGAALWGGSVIAILLGASILWYRFYKLVNKVDLVALLTK